MTALFTLDDLDPSRLRGARVLVRVDFNVPLDQGRVVDATRLEEALPTIHELQGAGARLLLASHCGRPKGRRDPASSLRPAAEKLGDLLGSPVRFAEDCVGAAAEAASETLAPGEICVLENLRYHPGETGNDSAFAEALSSLAEVFVNDAFGTAHRAHASVVGVAERLRERAAGRLMVREVEALSRLLGRARRPFAAVLGGAKIAGKIDTVENLLQHLDLLLVGGGMANTFLAAQGHDLGRSLVEADRLELAAEILQQAAARGVAVRLPDDLVVTDDLENPVRIETVPVGEVGAEMLAADVGQATRERFAAELSRAQTVFWNGPMGVFEREPFAAGTRAMAQALADCPGYTVIGGGETVAAARRAGILGELGHVSTGGGAALELLAGKPLPGVVALQRPWGES